MRLNKIEKDLNVENLKLNFSKFWTRVKIFVGGSFLAANIAACSPAVEDVDATTMAPTTTTESVVPSSSEEVTPSTEVEPSTSEVTPSTSETDPVEVQPTEVVDDEYVEADEFIALVESLVAKYPNIDKKQLVSAIIVSDFDHLDAETYDKVMDIYTLSDEELNDQYVAFMEYYKSKIKDVSYYYNGIEGYDNDECRDAYKNMIKFEEFALTDEDKEIARNYDSVFEQNASFDYGSFCFDEENGTVISDNSFENSCRRLQYFIITTRHLPGFDNTTYVK